MMGLGNDECPCRSRLFCCALSKPHLHFAITLFSWLFLSRLLLLRLGRILWRMLGRMLLGGQAFFRETSSQ